MSEQQKMDQERAAFEARIAALEAGQDSLILVRDEYKRKADEYRGKWAALQARASLAVGVPDGWALVPVDPTPDMVSAAEEAHMPFGDMDIALRMAILSATAAQPASQQSTTDKQSLTVAEQSAPGEVEEVEVVCVAVFGGIYHGGSGPELGDIDLEPDMKTLERIQYELVDSSDDVMVDLMTVAQHKRLMAAEIQKRFDGNEQSSRAALATYHQDT